MTWKVHQLLQLVELASIELNTSGQNGFNNIFGMLADYGFEYSDDNVEEEDVDIENQYYNSKGQSIPICSLP